MKLLLRGRLTKLLGEFSAWLSSRSVLVDRTMSSALASQSVSGRRPIFAILSADLLSCRVESFPPINAWRLYTILRKRLSESATGEFFFIHDVVDGKRNVVFFRFRDMETEACQLALFVVPESLLIARSMSASEVVTVTRDSSIAFISPTGGSHLAGGVINRRDQYASAMGLPGVIVFRDVNADQAFELAKNALTRLSIIDLYCALNRTYKRLLIDMSGPTGLFVALALSGYMLLASSYLVLMEGWRSYQNQVIAKEVAPLLESNRNLDRAKSILTAIQDVKDARLETWRLWEISSAIWSEGGGVRIWKIADGVVKVNGVAPSATAVMTKLAALQLVETAEFDAPVRSVGGGEEFAIELVVRGAGSANVIK